MWEDGETGVCAEKKKEGGSKSPERLTILSWKRGKERLRAHMNPSSLHAGEDPGMTGEGRGGFSIPVSLAEQQRKGRTGLPMLRLSTGVQRVKRENGRIRKLLQDTVEKGEGKKRKAIPLLWS